MLAYPSAVGAVMLECWGFRPAAATVMTMSVSRTSTDTIPLPADRWTADRPPGTSTPGTGAATARGPRRVWLVAFLALLLLG
ncbi:MAG: hypothetical protein EA388_04830, partial [Nitriliruptor sp.]